MRLWVALLSLLCAAHSYGQWAELRNGRLSGQYLLGTYPDDSIVREVIGSPTHDLNADLRVIVGGGKDSWDWQADYQLVLRSGDTLGLGRAFEGNVLVPNLVQNDDRRLMNLTSVISEDDNYVLLHRLDRLHLGYTGAKAVVKVGRQAISWGNGLIYNPVDFFNPFDPAAVDKEFKTGDDMVYAQYLQDSGNDLQFVSVWRRNAEGNTDNAVNTNALKYHAFVGQQEIDLLIGQHYEDTVASAGGITSVGGGIIRGDLMLTDTDLDTYASLVVNYSYSWVWGGKNMSGVFEYFHNGLGVREDDYANLEDFPDLTSRLARGELFTLGRDYFALGLTVEMTPLLNVIPNMFVNLGDGSGLAQFVAQWDPREDMRLLAALNIPFGGSGTEFGGLETGVDELNFSYGPGVFTQLAWYF